MNQTNELSTMSAKIATGFIDAIRAEVRSAKRRNFRNLLLVAIAAVGLTFASAVLFRDHLPDFSVTQAQDGASLRSLAPARGWLVEPTPRARDDAEDSQHRNHLRGVSESQTQGDISSPAPAPTRAPLSRREAEAIKQHIRSYH